MPRFISKCDIQNNPNFYLDEIHKGKIFVYPTDTVLGLGTNANIESSVKKIFQVKKRSNKALLIAVPSIHWILKNCYISKEALKHMSQHLPGAYSYICELKNPLLFPSVLRQGGTSIGLRIPDSWFCKWIGTAEIIFTSTSVNFSGKHSALTIADIPPQIIEQVDYVVDDEGTMTGCVSTLVDTRNTLTILER